MLKHWKTEKNNPPVSDLGHSQLVPPCNTFLSSKHLGDHSSKGITLTNNRAQLDRRAHPRYLVTDSIGMRVRIYQRDCKREDLGLGIEISEKGLCASLYLRLIPGEIVKLTYELASTLIGGDAIIRHKTAFLYGFEFLNLPLQQSLEIVRACASLQKYAGCELSREAQKVSTFWRSS